MPPEGGGTISKSGMMPIKQIWLLFMSGMLAMCVHTPWYYAGLKQEKYQQDDSRFGGEKQNNRIKYGSLVIWEDGAFSMSVFRSGEKFRCGGAWYKTGHENIIRFGFSSSCIMAAYPVFTLLNREAKTYVVSDKIELLINR